MGCFELLAACFSGDFKRFRPWCYSPEHFILLTLAFISLFVLPLLMVKMVTFAIISLFMKRGTHLDAWSGVQRLLDLKSPGGFNPKLPGEHGFYAHFIKHIWDGFFWAWTGIFGKEHLGEVHHDISSPEASPRALAIDRGLKSKGSTVVGDLFGIGFLVSGGVSKR